MILLRDIKNYNDRRLLSLSLLLFLPVLLDFLTAYRGAVNSVMTMSIYGLFGLLMFSYSVRQIRMMNIYPIIFYWSFCFLNFVAFPKLNEYFTVTSFILSTFFFFPISSLIIFRIDNWDNFFKIYTPFALISALLGVFIVFFSDTVESGNGEFFSYMEFSYNMLPSCMALYYVWRRNKSLIILVFFLINLVSIISFGSRAAVLFAFAFFISYEIFNSKIKTYKLIALTLMVILVAIFLEMIVGFLLQLGIFSNSRMLNHIVQENMFESTGRNFLSEVCKLRMSQMGLEFSGMFGDRPYLKGGVYPHNVFYEIIMQYGWLWGLGIIFLLLYAIGRDFFIKRNRTIVLFLVFSLFGRYLISGSYLIEGKFWIFIFSILSLMYFCNPRKFIKNSCQNSQ